MSAATTLRGGGTSDDDDSLLLSLSDNPLLQSWASQPLRLPPFGQIRVDHFAPALKEGMRLELLDLQAIVDDPDTPNFDNVLAAYDRS